jgi:cysteinyl-tRNA synthetase
VLTTHYRSKLNFTYESLTSAQTALNNLYSEISSFSKAEGSAPEFEKAFQSALNDDLNTPQAIAVVWDLIKNDELTSENKLASIFKLDEVLGFKLREIWESTKNVPEKVKKLVEDREAARKTKDFAKSDELRQEIESMGYALEDTMDGYRLKKKFDKQ